MLFYTIQFILMGQNDNIDEKYGLQAIVTLFDKLRKQNALCLAFGYNQVCHQSTPMLEHVTNPDPEPEIDKMNTMKLELMEEIPKLLHTLLKNKFPDAEAGAPADMAGYYEDVEKILYS